jgi:hypothetical protein
MFDSSFDFKYKNHQEGGPQEPYKTVHTYVFHTPQPYIFRAEEYDYKLFAVKFYPKSFEDSPKKYSLLTNENQAPPVIRTCINIMLDLFERFPDASFGFIGTNSEDEDKDSTQRFRIYKYLMENFFSPAQFSHYSYPQRSVYLLLNRIHKDPDLLLKIESMLKDIFAFEEKE